MFVCLKLRKISGITVFKFTNDIRVNCHRQNINKIIIKKFDSILTLPFEHLAEKELLELTKTIPSFQPVLTFYQEEDMSEYLYALTDKEVLTDGKRFKYNIIDWEHIFKNIV